MAIYGDQTALFITSGISMIGFIGILIAGVKPISYTATQLAEMTERLEQGDIEIKTAVEKKRSSSQLDDAFNHCLIIAENMKTKELMAKKLAEGDMTIDITPISERDLLGIQLKAISNRHI